MLAIRLGFGAVVHTKFNNTQNMESLIGCRVKKIGGSFQHTGIVVAEFTTTLGQIRLVLEFDEPVKGMLHIYRQDQVERVSNAQYHTQKNI